MPVDVREQERQQALIKKDNANSNSAASLNAIAKEKLHVHKAPKQLISTTKLAAAEQRANPRPPSSQPGVADSDYSDDAYE